jgi:hypothetical protein
MSFQGNFYCPFQLIFASSVCFSHNNKVILEGIVTGEVPAVTRPLTYPLLPEAGFYESSLSESPVFPDVLSGITQS